MWIWIILAAVVIFVLSGIRIIYEWEEGLIFTLGSYKGKRTSGLRWIIPIIQMMKKVDTRVRTIDVKPQETMTKDSVPAQLDAIIYFRVVDTQKSIIEVENFEQAAFKLAQTTLRDVVGKHDLDDLLAKKAEMGNEIMKTIQDPTDKWGIKVTNVEIKDVLLPEKMKRAMAKEAEATREKRARLTKAEAEFEASKKFKEASQQMDEKSMILRQLQTWQEIGTEQNSTLILVPTKLAEYLGEINGKKDK